MRALKFILTLVFAAIAVVAGFFVAAAAAVVALSIFLVGRLLGPNRIRVTGSTRFSRRQPTAQSPRSSQGDAIEVTATEVAADSPGSIPAARPDEQIRA